MSALPPKADIKPTTIDVRFVPKADILRRGEERRYSITASAFRTPYMCSIKQVPATPPEDLRQPHGNQ